MKIKFSKYQNGGSLITSTFTPVMATPGAYGPNLEAFEQSLARDLQLGAPKKEKENDGELTQKDLLESFKGIDGLTNDVNFVLNQIQHKMSLSEVLKDPITGSSPINLTSTYLEGLQYLNNVKQSKEAFNKAYDKSVQNETINEIAITSTGGVVVNTEAGIKTVSTAEYFNNRDKMQALTNGDLLQLRKTDPKMKFADGLLSIVDQGVSTKTIYSLINDFSSNLGTDKLTKEGYSKIEANNITNGLEILKEAHNNGIDTTGGLDGLFKSTNITEHQKRQVTSALEALYKMLPTNYRSLLAVKSGNAENPDKGVFDMLTLIMGSKTKTTLEFKIDDQTSKEGGSGDGSNGSGSGSKRKATAAEAWLQGAGEQREFNISLGEGNLEFNVRGNTMNMTDTSGNNLGTTTLHKVTSSGFGGILNVKDATIAGGNRIDINGSGKVIVDDQVTLVELPVDKSVKGIIRPDLDLLRRQQEANNKLKQMGIDASAPVEKLSAEQKQKINQVYRANTLPPKYDSMGAVIPSNYKPFGIVEGSLTDDAVEGEVNEKYVRNIDDEKARRSYETMRQQMGDKEFELDDPWLGFIGSGDKLYKTTIFIPVSPSYMSAVYGNGNTNNPKQGELMDMNRKDRVRQELLENGYKPRPVIGKTSFK